MSDEPIPVGVVGVGHLGRHHARLYAALPEARLVGVADRDRDRAAAIADEHGCEAFTDVAALSGRVRAASVAVPTVDHLAVAGELLESGVDVLVEKPLAVDVAQADELLEIAGRHGRTLMVGHTERFNPAIVALSRAVDAPRFFEIHRLAAFTVRSTDIDVVHDLMVHDLDLLLYLDGSDPVSVDAVGVAALTDKLDIANARIRLASGCVANLTASRISADQVRRVRVFQSRTYVACDTVRREVERYRLVVQPDGSPRIDHERLPVEPGEPLANELREFLAALSEGRPPSVDGRQGRRVLELAHQISASIERTAGRA